MNNEYYYEEVRREYYPKGNKLTVWDVLNEATLKYIPEERFSVNEQKDCTLMRIAERERCHKIYLDSLKHKK